MNFKIFVLIIFVMVLLSCSGDQKRYEIDISYFEGVWANQDCELVKTGIYEILFERADGKINATIRTFIRRENDLTIDPRGMTQFDTLAQTAIIRAKDLISGDKIIANNDKDNLLKLDTIKCEIVEYPEMLVIMSNGEVIEELSKTPKRLRVLFPSGNWQNLDLVEKLEAASPYEVIKATKDHIGTCLQQWTLGTSFQVDNQGAVNTIEIGTNKHSYVFSCNQGDDKPMIYCRAARIRSDNDGTVFAQNIRLMDNQNEFTAFMYPDNLEIADEPLVIADSLFNPAMCVYTKGAIYWSVKEFNDTMIVLNGCGQDYIYTRPHVDSGRIIEWFEFAEY